MSEIKKIKVSELKPLDDPNGYWMFGYKTENNRHVSKRVSWNTLMQEIEKAKLAIQLERRIIVAFERPQQLIPIGERMKVYNLVPRNISKLQYRENRSGSEWKELIEGVEFSGNDDIILKINGDQQSVSTGDYEKYSTLTIFAKKINK